MPHTSARAIYLVQVPNHTFFQSFVNSLVCYWPFGDQILIPAARFWLLSRLRGPVDVVARVAAVSPVIRVKNAPPFFMVEVEQLEQPDRENPRHLCSRNVGGKDECLPPSRSHLSETNPRCPIKKGERERPMPEAICRSPEEIAAIFASSTETRPDSTGDPAGGVYRENGNCFAAADVPHVSRKPTVVMFRGRVLSEGVTNKVGQRGSKGCGGGGDQRSSVSEEANRESKPKEQLMTNLILNGQRCLPWQAFITPGKTYVFPAMGAFVLGGSKKMYRAFGDAAGGRVETRVGQPVVLPRHGDYIERMLSSPQEQ